MCSTSNIPLEKSDHPAVKNFLKKHVIGGAEIPSASALRKNWLPKVFNKNDDELKMKFSLETQLAILVDETTDLLNRPILNILFKSLDLYAQESVLVKTTFLSIVNFSTVSRAIILLISIRFISLLQMVQVTCEKHGLISYLI